jgi:putative peptide zinc metalloprotease protein
MIGQPASLPPLREDLALAPGPAARDGAPTWTLFDPVRNRYFALETAALRLLRNWGLSEPAKVLAATKADGGQPLDARDLTMLLTFLSQNELLDARHPTQRAALQSLGDKARTGIWHKRFQDVLFLRIPLVRPDRFLTRTWPLIAPIASRGVAITIAMLGLTGLYLVGRDWDRFVGDASAFANPGGALLFALTLAFTKTLHELGHAYAAKRHGLRVHTMGVAILVFVPVIYTDVSDAWRLTSRRARLGVGAAGVIVELAIACIATFVWSFLPAGALRDATLIIASVTWVTTLVVNLNPLMRFDGYFLLSDLIGVANLQSRGFALGRWRLREMLFGLGDRVPETLPKRVHNTLLVWCVAAWLWRLIIFVGIAFAVYYTLPKAIGLPMLIVELAWFVVLPITREISAWWKRRDDITLNKRTLITGLLVFFGLVLSALPWPLGIDMPARLEATRASVLYAPAPAQIVEVSVKDGTRVKAGETLMVLAAPDLDHRMAQARRRIVLAQLTLQRQAARPESASRTGVVEEELAADLAMWRGLAEQAQRLTITAPHDGIVRDMSRGLDAGRWIGVETRLARVVAGPQRVEGYAEAADVSRLSVGTRGRFIPDDPARASQAIVITLIDPTAAGSLTIEALASPNGGPIAANRDPEGRLTPARAVWSVGFAIQKSKDPEKIKDPKTLTPEAANGDDQSDVQIAVSGRVKLSTAGEAPFARLWRAAIGLIIRESGF